MGRKEKPSGKICIIDQKTHQDVAEVLTQMDVSMNSLNNTKHNNMILDNESRSSCKMLAMNNKICITQQNMSFDGIMTNSQIENSFAEYERSGKPGALPYCFNNSL